MKHFRTSSRLSAFFLQLSWAWLSDANNHGLPVFKKHQLFPRGPSPKLLTKVYCWAKTSSLICKKHVYQLRQRSPQNLGTPCCVYAWCCSSVTKSILGTVACQASPSSTISWSLCEFMSTELVMLSNHVIFCCPLLLLPSIFPSIRVFSNELVFPSDGQNAGASASVLPMSIQGWFPLGLAGFISLLSKGLSRVYHTFNYCWIVPGVSLLSLLKRRSHQRLE